MAVEKKAKTTDDLNTRPSRPRVSRSLSDPTPRSKSIAPSAESSVAAEDQGEIEEEQQQEEALPDYDPIRLPAYDIDEAREADEARFSTAEGNDNDSQASSIVPTSPVSEYAFSNSDEGQPYGSASDQAWNFVPPADIDWIPSFPGGPPSGHYARSLIDPNVWYYVL
ncbi:MAG: hypothetical protein LQ337_001595 [Flavoplaca oasis]|nr:MAG: hypothetical protein LQ337_001595 [Flavoplaca oasis]